MPLTQFMQGVIAGAAGGLVTDKAKDTMGQALPHVDSPWEQFLHDFPEKFERMAKDLHDLAHAQTLVPDITSANLFAYPAEEKLNYKGRQHISVFVLTAFPVRIFVANAGVYTPTFAAGWNALDLPEGSTLALPQGTAGNQLVMIMASDTSLGNAI